ncbi:hypothetical protein BpHYR1_028149 [Brachionus plicatilis]|uniref:Uncharacterized protein n=1 Tax=Brachionus plicatilis TaxID=10195 RepID=A0A3M7PN38_BRAPC|nr:hypothetical protein BpHYR1_028149 [Brachionus plicatilis]
MVYISIKAFCRVPELIVELIISSSSSSSGNTSLSSEEIPVGSKRLPMSFFANTTAAIRCFKT